MAQPTATPLPAIPEDEEYYSSWSLFLVCLLLILSLWTSYYLQIKRIRAVHETGVSIIAGMAVGLIVRLAPGTMIREMLVSKDSLGGWVDSGGRTRIRLLRVAWQSVHDANRVSRHSNTHYSLTYCFHQLF